MLQGKAEQGTSVQVVWHGRQSSLAPAMTNSFFSLASQDLNSEALLGHQVPLGHQASQATHGPASAWRTSHLTCTVRHGSRAEEGRGLHGFYKGSCGVKSTYSCQVLIQHVQGWALGA